MIFIFEEANINYNYFYAQVFLILSLKDPKILTNIPFYQCRLMVIKIKTYIKVLYKQIDRPLLPVLLSFSRNQGTIRYFEELFSFNKKIKFKLILVNFEHV